MKMPYVIKNEIMCITNTKSDEKLEFMYSLIVRQKL